MKKIFIPFLFIFFFITDQAILFGQKALNKGSFSISGSVQYSSNSSSDNLNHSFQDNNFTFSPQFVVFVADHFSIGAVINYNSSNQSINSNNASDMSNLSFGPSFRYYFYVKEFNPFIETSFNIYLPVLQSSNSDNFYGINLKGGIDYFLSESVAVEPSLSYSYSSNNLFETGSNDSIINEFAIDIGINYFIF
jgi:opacity protein-like surface antigen